MADRLATLARLRKLQADLARTELGEAARLEATAEASLAAAHQAPAREAALVAYGPDHPDAEAARWLPAAALAAAFASWLPTAAAAIAQRGLAAAAAAAARVQAGEEAAARKGALEAVETLIEARRIAERKRALRKAQSALDAMGSRPRRDA